MNPTSVSASAEPPNRPALVLVLFGLLPVLLLSSCTTTSSNRPGALRGTDKNHPAVKQRAAQIAAEPVGDYGIGRRYWTEGTRFWGYLRRPRQPWEQAKLIVFNESYKVQPDRLPEAPESGPGHGFDHNYEYRIYGNFSGQVVYDPNSNLELPEFVLTGYELINATPGFLFQPGERYNSKRLPPKFPPVPR